MTIKTTKTPFPKKPSSKPMVAASHRKRAGGIAMSATDWRAFAAVIRQNPGPNEAMLKAAASAAIIFS